MPPVRLVGRTAVVTGGGTGLGFAAARRLAADGALVYIVGRRAAVLDQAAAAIGADVRVLVADIGDPVSLDAAFEAVREQRGGLDIVVAGAGVADVVAPMDVTVEYFERTYAVNVKGTFFTVQKAVPLMPDGGSIVLVSSAMHNRGLPSYVVYASTKAAIRSMTRSWAAELAPRGIRVNCVSPGPIDTPIIRGQFPDETRYQEMMARFAESTPLGRVGHPDEVAEAIHFLATDRGAYITAADLVVDGGRNNI